MLEEHCHVVAVLGMGGIGKTTLTFKLCQELKDHFDFVVWQSLFNAPPLETLLTEILQFLVAPAPLQLSSGLETRLLTLLTHLQNKRVLLVLDNWETVLQGERLAGVYRSGYEGYGKLLESLAQSRHQSCLIITSRETPRELGLMGAKVSSVRSLSLAGLVIEEAQYLLQNLKLKASPESQQALVKRYRGNPLALKLVAEPLQTLFEGKIEAFLAEEWTVFGEIEQVIAQQLKRLNMLEQELIYWLAIEREPVSLQQLSQNLVLAYSFKDVAEALISLSRRNLLEKEYNEPRFGLQPVLLEYLTERLVKQASAELVSGQLRLIQSHALLKAEAKGYVKDSQRRLILRSILASLLNHFANKTALETHLQQVLSTIWEQPFEQQSYSGGNILNLLGLLKGDLNGYDFSGLRVWQANLQGIELHGVNFEGGGFRTECFHSGF